MQYITYDFFMHLEKSKTKIAQKVLQAMDKDIMHIVEYEKCFWFEKTWSGANIPNYAWDYAQKWAKNRGLTYNLDL